jgi:hypothetical protein
LISSWSVAQCYRIQGSALARKDTGFFHQASSWKKIRNGWDTVPSGLIGVTGTMVDSVITCRFILISIPKVSRTEELLFDRFITKFFSLRNHQIISFLIIISDDPVEDGLLNYTFNNADRF